MPGNFLHSVPRVRDSSDTDAVVEEGMGERQTGPSSAGGKEKKGHFRAPSFRHTRISSIFAKDLRCSHWEVQCFCDMLGESFVRVVSWEVSAVFALFLPVLLPRYLNRDESRRRRRPRCPSVVSEAGHPSPPSPPLQYTVYLPKKKNWRRPRCRTVFTIPFFTAPSFRVREGKCGSRKSLRLCDAIPSE